MNKLILLGIALILLLIAYPLVSIGTVQEIPAVWWIGLLALVLGGIIPPVTRYMFREEEEQAEEERPEEKRGNSTEKDMAE